MEESIWLAWQIAFIWFLIAAVWFPCCGSDIVGTGECAYCAGSYPNASLFAVELIGFANDSCTECADYDGTYITGDSSGTGMGYCAWYYPLNDNTHCSADGVGVEVEYGTGIMWNYFVVLFAQKKSANYNIYRWQNASPGTLNCLELDAYAVAYNSRILGISDAGVSCDASGATCEVTSTNS